MNANLLKYPFRNGKMPNFRGPDGVRQVGRRRARQLRAAGHLVVWNSASGFYCWGPGLVRMWNGQLDQPKEKRLRWRLRPWGPEVVPTRRHGSTDTMSKARVSSPF